MVDDTEFDIMDEDHESRLNDAPEETIDTTKGNFCRVLEIPATRSVGSHAFCHNGGYDYPVKIIDWFCPFTGFSKRMMPKEEVIKSLVDFVKSKPYFNPDSHIVMVCDNGLIIPITSNTPAV